MCDLRRKSIFLSTNEQIKLWLEKKLRLVQHVSVSSMSEDLKKNESRALALNS